MAARIIAAVVALLTTAAHAASLPSVHARKEADVQKSAKWWARLDDKIYHAPPASMLELSQDVSKYYYAVGSTAALSPEMKAARVGGQGRFHIFHLPQGPSMLQLSSTGDRRSSLSALVQLQNGADLGEGDFPEYTCNASYAYPGSSAAQQAENSAAALVTADMFKGYLAQITDLGVNQVDTRSYDNPEASKVVQAFLQEQFHALGLPSCLQKFTVAGKELANVVAYIPGKSSKTVTLGAHYDSRPFSGAAPGAEDNGSGVANLLAVAKAFMQSKLKPEKTIYFAGFAAEEPGLMGSKAYAEALLQDPGGVRAALMARGGADEGTAKLDSCSPDKSFLQTSGRRLAAKVNQADHSAIILDEVGWKSPKLTRPTVNLESKDWTAGMMNQLAQANKDHNNGALKVIHNSQPFGSDHMSFLDRGMPSVLVINGDDEAYPNYHKLTDTMENVDTEYAAQIGKTVLGGLVRLAGLQV